MKLKFLFPVMAIVLSFSVASAFAQTNAYQQTNLVSDMAGVANHTDSKLINPWGISFFPGQAFWIADNNSGFSTVYDANGVFALSVLIPAPRGDASTATPTGTVINATSGFKVGGTPSQFLFDSEDGTISGWNGTGNAILAVDNSAGGAVYKGLAMLSPADSATYLAATNFNSGSIEAYTTNFNPLAPAGSFTDPHLPAGYAPFNIQQVGTQVFVTYAVQNQAKHDPVNGAGNGIVSIYDLDGNFVKRFASNGPLNSPWGVVQASASFGAFSNDILIGNFGDGTINAFDPTTGDFLGQLQDSTGHAITNGSLWALVFGAGGTGDSNTLYFTAGLANEGHGLFAALAANVQGSADFSVSPSPQSGTVSPGGSKSFALTITPANGFAGTVSFNCTAPSGITCSFNPPTVTPAGGAVRTMMTASVSTGYSRAPMGMAIAGLGLFGCFFAGTGATRRRRYSLLLGSVASVLIVGTLLVSTGCGGYSKSMNGSSASVVVTATSGSITHTTTINLTVMQ